MSSRSLPLELTEVLKQQNYIPVIGWGYPDFAPRPAFSLSPSGHRVHYLEASARSWLDFASSRVRPLYYAAAQLPVRKVISLTPDRALEDILRYFNPAWISLSGDQADHPAEQPLLFQAGGDPGRTGDWLLESTDYLKFSRTCRVLYDQLCLAAARAPLLILGCDPADEALRLFLTSIRDIAPPDAGGWLFCKNARPEDIYFWKEKGFEIIQGPCFRWLRQLVYTANCEYGDSKKSIDIARPGRSPYKNLDFFGRKDRDIFFGRDEDSRNLINEILAHRLVVVAGPSGAGKTSLINASILAWTDDPANNLMGVSTRCGENPVNSIRASLSEQIDSGVPNHPGQSLQAYLKLIHEKTKKLPIIVIDQGEELFTQVGTELLKELFRELHECTIPSPLIARFVLCMRDDFISRLASETDFLKDILHNLYCLEELSPDQAIEAILGPARIAGIEFEEGLAQRIIKDFGPGKIAPPQIQIVVTQLYEARSGNKIDLAVYDRLGGNLGILNNYLNREIGKTGDNGGVVKEILKAMVTSEGTKDVLTLAEISKRAVLDAGLTQEIVLHLRDVARLVRGVNQDEVYKFELAHEYLTGQIWEWMSKEEISKRQIEDLLTKELRSWRRFDHLRLGPDRLQLFEENHPILEPDADGITLLLLSSVKNLRPAVIWLQKLADQKAAVGEYVARKLFEYFWNKDIQQRREAAETIAELDPSLITGMLSSDRADYRKAALDMVGGIGIKSVSDKILALLDDEDPDIAELACGVLGEILSDGAAKRLMIIARDSDRPRMQIAAIRALGNSYQSRALPVIKNNLRSKDPDVRYATEEMIIKTGDVRMIRDLLDGTSTDADKDALWVLISRCSQRTKAGIRGFISTLSDHDIKRAIDIVLNTTSFSDDLLSEFRKKGGLLREFAIRQMKEKEERRRLISTVSKRLDSILDSNTPLKRLAEFLENQEFPLYFEMIDRLVESVRYGFEIKTLLRLLKGYPTMTRAAVLGVLYRLEKGLPDIDQLLKDFLQESDPTILYHTICVAKRHNISSVSELISRHIDNPQTTEWSYYGMGDRVMDVAGDALDKLRPQSKVWRKSFQKGFR